jgi:hypothetical protein
MRSCDDMKWIISFVTCWVHVLHRQEKEKEKKMEEKWNGNAQGKGITLGHFISPVIGV